MTFNRKELDDYVKGVYADPKRLTKSDARDIGMARVNARKRNNPAFSERISQKIKAQYADPIFKIAKQQKQLAVAQTPEWKAAHAEGLRKRNAKPEWKAAYEVSRQKRLKPIHTPHGDFESRGAAVEHMTSIGIGNAYQKLAKWLKTNPTEYYYIV